MECLELRQFQSFSHFHYFVPFFCSKKDADAKDAIGNTGIEKKNERKRKQEEQMKVESTEEKK